MSLVSSSIWCLKIMPGFYLDAPTSLWSSAYDKAHRTRSTAYALPVSKSKAKPALLAKLKSLGKSDKASSPVVHSVIHSTPALESQFFRLPLAVREKIYGYVVGQNELLHMLLRYRSAPPRWEVAYRRCGAGGRTEDCVLKHCREFHDHRKGSYFGYFNHVGGLFLACRDFFKEASLVLYSQNTLEFDHPLSLITFSSQVSVISLQSIRCITIDLQQCLYIYGSNEFSPCTSLHPTQWPQMWDVIAAMQGLEEVRVRFQLLINGWLGWTEEEILEPLWKVTTPLRIFEVEMPLSSRDVGLCSNYDDDDFDEDEDNDNLKTEAPFTLIKY